MKKKFNVSRETFIKELKNKINIIIISYFKMTYKFLSLPSFNGWIGSKVRVFKHPSLNHLMFKIMFFASGYSRSTQSVPWGRVETDILSFFKNKYSL